jgi:hypothetical protein
VDEAIDSLKHAVRMLEICKGGQSLTESSEVQPSLNLMSELLTDSHTNLQG